MTTTDRVTANLTAAQPALATTVAACERLAAALEMRPGPDRYYAIQRETRAIEQAAAELEPHRDRLPYLHAEIPGNASEMLRYARADAQTETDQYRRLARQTAQRMRGIVGSA